MRNKTNSPRRPAHAHATTAYCCGFALKRIIQQHCLVVSKSVLKIGRSTRLRRPGRPPDVARARFSPSVLL
ncbi:hypothetical protein EVAR_31814_1 [Eumeta japonica]|uniref:Uncharacterized protein n=1 Tax=Eumeta variegata TaxID=151549 RepID=A0A4C1W316_EUMVA|nr:hypothetical protein EVAR_31814_1 [Eumeta japonica]